MGSFPQNISPQQADALLKLAGQKLGRDPQTLRTQMESGQIENLLQNLNPQQRQKVASVLGNRQAMNQLLENPQVRQLLSHLTKGR